MSTAKAGEVLGWEPEHTWREAEDEEDVGEPDVQALETAIHRDKQTTRPGARARATRGTGDPGKGRAAC